MIATPQLLLIGAVLAVGVLHTIVPDHWAPIALMARQRGWSGRQTALAAAQAGVGHVATTLVIAAVVWGAGAAVATRFGHWVDLAASLALIGFGGWIAISAWRELGGHGHGHHHHAHGNHHDHDHDHDHGHDHGHGHSHGHHHHHDHERAGSQRTALLLILGSSPMVEGIPAFFAASKYGLAQLAIMSAVFAASTIVTYVALCVAGAASLQQLRLGPFERYGEVLSGAFIAVVGAVFLIFPTL